VIGVGVIGLGHWGPNLVRVFDRAPDSRVVAVCDRSPARLAGACVQRPSLWATTDARALIAHRAVDAVIVATPAATHFALAHAALGAGKDVLVEKPIATTSENAARLIETAARRRRVLMVDHTYVYAGAVQALRELVRTGAIGVPASYRSVRSNQQHGVSDEGVLWDLAVHDLAIIDYVFAERPTAVAASAPLPPEPASLTLHFDAPLTARIETSWYAAEKCRQIAVLGSHGELRYDDLARTAKLRLENGTSRAVEHGISEPLAQVAAHFLSCVRSATQPLTDGACGLRTVQVLEAANRSLANRGRPERIDALPHDAARVPPAPARRSAISSSSP